MRDPRSSTIDDILRRSALRSPGAVALVFEDRTWTYRDLDDAVSRAADLLLKRGFAKGDRIAAYGQNSDSYLIAFLACCRAGLVHVPINYALTGDELGYLLQQSGASFVLTDPKLAPNLGKLDGAPDHLLLRDSDGCLLELVRDGAVPDIDVEVADTDLAQLLYTSGTTSRPKGAMMTHRAYVHHYASVITALDIQPGDVLVQAMPLYHTAQMHVFMLPALAMGTRSYLLETPDIPKILELVESKKVTSLFLAPTVWVPLSQHPDFPQRDLTSLQKAYYGASIMPGPVRERIAQQLPDLGWYNCFGQTEIGPLATVLRPEEHADRPDSCGRPVLFVDMRVIDANGNDVEPGGVGEVVYRSPQLCLGYWDKPEETAEAFEGGWFHSGDLVRIDEEGYITVVDRIKDVINTGGVLVASREVEDCLYTHPDVAQVAVIGTPDEKWIEAVTAVVVRKPDATVTADDLIAHAKANLAKYKVPKSVHFVDDLPRNASGKLLKRVLRDQLA
ncbi:acyl-CoA synthetase [Sporichthya brevicatena]|uniref:Acyl-CoA synthetase n=1 Tax=Sporichthya brevicatena TaxID=171442 RepID=A0ABN1G3E9_9ACTN